MLTKKATKDVIFAAYSEGVDEIQELKTQQNILFIIVSILSAYVLIF